MCRRLILRHSAAWLGALALAVTGLPAAADENGDAAPMAEDSHRIPLALMGTIPIYWGEVDGGFRGLVSGKVHPHWARAQLEEEGFTLHPLDYLTPETLAPFEALLMAQPRGLTPEENVALDGWVRAGGRLLLLADPAMTGHWHHPLGDRRRPQDTILLSPILAHWGLELLFDADQPEGPQMREFAGEGDSARIPINLAGHFSPRDSDAHCALKAAETLALCMIGEGQAVILADAAILDRESPMAGSSQAFYALYAMAFGSLREFMGSDAPALQDINEASVIADEIAMSDRSDQRPPKPPDPPPSP